MNKRLLEEIVRHVMASFAIIPSEFIDFNKTRSLKEKSFLLSSKIKFDGEEELGMKTGQVWGCQLSADESELKILLANCSQDPDIYEHAMLIQLKNAPCYGLYFIYQDGDIESEAMIAASVNGKEWLQCNTFLQASFLTGMEQVKETGLTWNKCSSHQEEYEKLLSFIEYHHLVYGESDEGQENGL